MTTEGPRPSTGALGAGIVFVILGLMFLLDALDVWTLEPEVLWPVALIGFGVAILAGANRR